MILEYLTVFCPDPDVGNGTIIVLFGKHANFSKLPIFRELG